jgi:Fibronectin type III domain
MQARLSTGEPGFASGRLLVACLIGSLAIALAGCGADGSAAAAGTTTTSNTSNTSAGSTTSTTATGTADETSKGGGSTTTSTPPTAPPPKAATTTSVTLGWVPPTRNNDGSLITNLAGYKIHYGTASSEYTQTIALQNAGLTRYVVDNLPSGTYYFAITAYNSQGIESPLSGEVSTIVD